MTETENSTCSKDENTIFTIGHGNAEASNIVSLLKKWGIQILVDVRSAPYSRYANQFNRETFDITLARHGIQYKYAGEYLGGRPRDPDCYFKGIIPTGEVDYLHEVNYDAVMGKAWFQKGIQGLLHDAENHTVAVMCSEEDPRRCHRHYLIACYLLQQGIQVKHIRKTGELVSAEQYSLLVSRREKQEVEPPLLLLAPLQTETHLPENSPQTDLQPNNEPTGNDVQDAEPGPVDAEMKDESASISAETGYLFDINAYVGPKPQLRSNKKTHSRKEKKRK